MAEPFETYRGVVFANELDHIGHMNVRFYMAKFDEANWQFFAAVGLDGTYLRESGFGMGAVRHVVEYKRELFAGDVVVIRSHVAEVTERKVRAMHRMYHALTGVEVASLENLAVHFDRHAHKSSPFPPAIYEKLAALVS